MTQKVNKPFNIIHHRGSLNDAVLHTGEHVSRKSQMLVQNMTVGESFYTGFVPCLDYQSHFIYETPINENYRGYPAHMCTCGSFAVIAPTDSFRQDTSQPGLAFVCYYHHIAVNERTGKKLNKHADGSYG
jgi:hypothetical protein